MMHVSVGGHKIEVPPGASLGGVANDLAMAFMIERAVNPVPKEYATWIERIARKVRRSAESQPWCILKITPGMERKVAIALGPRNRETPFGAGLTIYVPLEKYRPAHTWRSRTRPLMPGYAFALLRTDEELDLARANNAVKVISRQTDDGKSRPVTVPASVIGSLILWEWTGAFDRTWNAPPPIRDKRRGRRPPRHEWKKGERARVAGGPFEGHLAEIVSAERADRMGALIALFGQATEVWLDEDMLEKLG